MASISKTQNNSSLYEAIAPHVKTINQVFLNEKDYQRYSDLYLDAVRHRNAAFLKAALLLETAALDPQEETARDLFEQTSYTALFTELVKFKTQLKKHKVSYNEYHREKAEATPKKKLNSWTKENTTTAAASTPAAESKKMRLPLTPLNYFNATIAKK